MPESFNNFPPPPDPWNLPPPQPAWGTPPPAELPQWGNPAQPYEQALPQPVQSTPKWRKFAAGAAFVGTLAGGGYAASEAIDFNQSEAAVSQTNETKAAEALPQLSPDLITVQSDFELALTGDTCDVKVTAAEAAGVYGRLFGGTDLAKLKLEDLTAEADKASQTMQEKKNLSEFVPLPAEQYAELLADAWSEAPQKSINEYTTFLDSYASEYGMTTMYTWETPTDGFNTELPLRKFIEPMTAQQLADSPNAKRAIVEAAQDLSLMPKSVVANTEKKRLVFGNIIEAGVLGGVTSNTDVYLDASSDKYDVDMLGGFGKDDQMVLSHELGHGLEKSICGLASFFGYTPEDKAYTALNKNYQYGDAGRKQIEAGEYSSLESNDTTAELAVVRDYSHDNEAEDKATVLGEHVLNTEQANEIYAGPEDASILRKKLTLLIARVAKHNPAAGEYYVALMQTARVQHELVKRQSVENDKAGELLFAPEATGTTDELMNSPEYQAAEAEAKKIGVTLESLKTKIAG